MERAEREERTGRNRETIKERDERKTKKEREMKQKIQRSTRKRRIKERLDGRLKD